MSANLAAVPQPGSVMSAEFTYESLEYAAKEIRLVEIIRRTDQVFEVRLSKYEISDAPEYNAISYTWGDGETTRMTDIIVNGQKMQVTENCRYALEQAHCQYHLPQPKRVHFWIDSICINQNSHMEKQHQVAMMGRIYAQAVRVLACVGRHRDNSEDLAALLQEVEIFCLNNAEQQESFARTGQVWFDRDDLATRTSVAEFILARDHIRSTATDIYRFPRTFFDFSQRYYWTRLWIIQEVAVAKHLEILCGSDRFSRSDFYLLHWIAGDESDYFDPRRFVSSQDENWRLTSFYDNQSFSNFKFVLSLKSTDRIPALEILSFESPFGCSTPEDRVYGMLSLMKWPEVNPPIHVEPIYTPSVNFDLAGLFLSLPNCNLENIQGIFKALEICHNLDKIEELVAARSTLSPTFSDISKHPVCHYDLDISTCRVISTSKEGYLTSYLSSRRKWLPDHSPTVLNMIKNAPQLLYVEGEVAALLCNGASEGDLVFPTPFGQCLLVLRYSGSFNHYDIVGQGLFIEGFYIDTDCDPGLPKPPIEEIKYAKHLFNYFVDKHTSLLGNSLEVDEEVFTFCHTNLNEIYDDEEVSRNRNCEDQSTHEKGKLEIIDALRGCARQIEGLCRYKSYPRTPVSVGQEPVILELEPREMLLLGCQDLEKDGSRNESKMMQRLNTTVLGRAFTKPIAEPQVTEGELHFIGNRRTHQLLG